MNNDAAFFIVSVLDLGIVFLLFRYGKEGLLTALIINLILVSVLGAALTSVFGFVTNAGNIYYAATFLSMNILLEHYGKKDAYKFLLLGFLSVAMFIILIQFSMKLDHLDESVPIINSLQTLFSFVPRVSLASLTAYLIAHLINIKFYDYLHTKYGKHHLWLRNIVSTSIAQAIDSLIFFTLAFYGTIGISNLLETIITGFFLKTDIALLSTPFLYLSYKLIKPKIAAKTEK